MSTSAVNVQAVAARGSAAPGDNADADILVLVTDPSTGAAVTSLSQTDFTVVGHIVFVARPFSFVEKLLCPLMKE